jgi:hypothetical protein
MSKSHGKNLITDKKTDYLFEYFINEDKFNDQLKEELDEDIENKISNEVPRLDSRIMSEGSNSKYLSPANRNYSEMNVEFNDEESAANPVHRSPYGQRINPVSYSFPPEQRNEASISRPMTSYVNPPPIQPIDPPKTINKESDEDRRARARENYTKLLDLQEKYNVKLTRQYSINDDPDDMEDEYNMHKNRRNKNNQIKFYKQTIYNVCSGIEFLNENYNPFEFKLKDWSRQISSDLDDYTDVLEELYEKYKGIGGNIAPEIRLLFMIVSSAFFYHVSNVLFGGNNLENTIKNNPNIISKIMGTITGSGEQKQDVNVPDNRNVLETIRNLNKEKVVEKSDSISKERLEIEREKRLLAERKAEMEMQARKQSEMFNEQMEQLRNHQLALSQTSIRKSPDPLESGINQVLSDARKRPRYQENKILNKEDDIFGSEVKSATNIPIKIKSSSAKKPKISFDEIIESLDESTTDDISDMVVSNKNKPKENSISKSASRSVSERSSKKKDIIRL